MIDLLGETHVLAPERGAGCIMSLGRPHTADPALAAVFIELMEGRLSVADTLRSVGEIFNEVLPEDLIEDLTKKMEEDCGIKDAETGEAS